MEFKTLTTIKLREIDFENSPTDTQVERALREMSEFLDIVIGVKLASGEEHMSTQKIGALANCSIHLSNSAKAFAGTSNLAVPQHLAQR